jgi:hypothetical protein
MKVQVESQQNDQGSGFGSSK